jgi:hypothetical protein
MDAPLLDFKIISIYNKSCNLKPSQKVLPERVVITQIQRHGTIPRPIITTTVRLLIYLFMYLIVRKRRNYSYDFIHPFHSVNGIFCLQANIHNQHNTCMSLSKRSVLVEQKNCWLRIDKNLESVAFRWRYNPEVEPKI